MVVVISRSLVLGVESDVGVYDERRLNGPIIGWQTLTQFGGITASSEDEDHPAVNLSNPATHLFWRSLTTDTQTLEFSLSDISPIDYVGIARHNLGSSGTQVSLQYQTGVGDSWELLTSEFILPGDDPVIIRFPERDASRVRITLSGALVPPEIAVVYIGLLLQLQRNIYVGHTPINMGRRTRVTNGRSESGNFIGRVVTGRSKATSISMSNLTPRWYRARMEPFVISAEERPFFFAWRPDGYPREVGYCWSTDDFIPVNQLPNGMMQVDMNIAGIAGDGRTVIV